MAGDVCTGVAQQECDHRRHVVRADHAAKRNARKVLLLHLFIAEAHLFRASAELFHTGWFVESLSTQTLVLFVIRTAGNPFRSRPSLPLTITTLAVVLVGIVLPFSPLANFLGFVPLPLDFFLFLTLLTVTYLLVVQVAKRRLMRRWLGE